MSRTVFAAVCLVSMLMVLSGCRAMPHSSDEVLLENFYAHQADFEKLAAMLHEDPKLVRLTPDRAYLEPGAAPLSQERMDEYKRLLRLLGLHEGITRDPQGLHLIASTRGVAVPNSAKSYSYTVKEPSPLVDSLDAVIQQNRGDQRPVWRRISGNWYLSYESW